MAERDASRPAAIEAPVAGLVRRCAAQDQEIAALKGAIDQRGPVNVRISNLRGGLDDLEGVAHRHPEDEDERASDDDGDDHQEDDDDGVDEGDEDGASSREPVADAATGTVLADRPARMPRPPDPP